MMIMMMMSSRRSPFSWSTCKSSLSRSSFFSSSSSSSSSTHSLCKLKFRFFPLLVTHKKRERKFLLSCHRAIREFFVAFYRRLLARPSVGSSLVACEGKSVNKGVFFSAASYCLFFTPIFLSRYNARHLFMEMMERRRTLFQKKRRENCVQQSRVNLSSLTRFQANTRHFPPARQSKAFQVYKFSTVHK